MTDKMPRTINQGEFLRFATIFAVITCALLAACSKGHPSNGTSALDKQLVGHWANASDDHLYFGPIDPGSKTGSFIMVHPDGKVFTHRYELASEDAGARKLEANLLFASGDSRETTYVISPDGKTLDSTTVITGIETKSQMSRVDDATSP